MVKDAVGLLVALYAVFSGMNDGGNLLGTFLLTRSIAPRFLVPILILSVIAGPFLLGTAVSHTIAVQILNFPRVGLDVLGASILAALLTLLTSWALRVPSSTTVALAGGMVGVAWATGPRHAIHWLGVDKVAVGVGGSLVVGFIVCFVAAKILWRVLHDASVTTGRRLGYLQPLTVIAQGLAYGANGFEKSLGLAALFDVMAIHPAPFGVTAPVIGIVGLLWVVGLVLGGIRIARTIGGHIFRVRPLHSVTVQASSALVVVAAALMGVPVSNTQALDGALFGLGSALAPRRVQWRTASRIFGAWVAVVPLSLAAGFLVMMAAHAVAAL